MPVWDLNTLEILDVDFGEVQSGFAKNGYSLVTYDSREESNFSVYYADVRSKRNKKCQIITS